MMKGSISNLQFGILCVAILAISTHLFIQGSEAAANTNGSKKLVNPGFPGIFCPAPGEAKALVNCSIDCQFGHNAKFGNCLNNGDEFHCYCGPPGDNGTDRYGQCMDPEETMWFEICDIDCKCTHGGLKGRCNYETHACECVGNSNGAGINLCPFTENSELLHWFNESYVAVGMAEFAEAVLNDSFSAKSLSLLEIEKEDNDYYFLYL